jgi:hypothetical protein
VDHTATLGAIKRRVDFSMAILDVGERQRTFEPNYFELAWRIWMSGRRAGKLRWETA